MRIAFTLDGEPFATDASPAESLLTVLRRDAGRLSVRETCGLGVCGACTVLVDGEPLSSCLLLAPLAAGRAVATAERLPDDDPIVQAFADAHAFQCGYCIPGFVLTVKRLLEETPEPSDAEIRLALAGNLCRCGSYLKIAAAVRLAAARRRG